MKYNFHTHTYRCRHASGTIEEYIQRAINFGIETIGFSDHMPFIRSDGCESSYRVPFGEAKDYVSELALLRKNIKTKLI